MTIQRPYSLVLLFTLATSLILPGSGLSQFLREQMKTLTVQGSFEETPLIEINGRSYVELETLTRLLNGSLSVDKNHFVLALPSVSSRLPVTTPQGGSFVAPEFSKDFLRSSIEEMTVIREWRSSLTTAVQRGYPVTDEWVDSFRAQAQAAFLLASLDVSTESDQKVVRFLANEFTNMEKLSGKFVEANKSMTYLFPGVLQDDPLDQRILNCAHALAEMAASGEFADDGSCQ